MGHCSEEAVVFKSNFRESSSTIRRRGGYFYRLGFRCSVRPLKCDFVRNAVFSSHPKKQSGHVQPAGEVRAKSHVVMPEQTGKTR